MLYSINSTLSSKCTTTRQLHSFQAHLMHACLPSSPHKILHRAQYCQRSSISADCNQGTPSGVPTFIRWRRAEPLSRYLPRMKGIQSSYLVGFMTGVGPSWKAWGNQNEALHAGEYYILERSSWNVSSSTSVRLNTSVNPCRSTHGVVRAEWSDAERSVAEQCFFEQLL